MDRKRQLKYNTASSLIHQIVIVISGLILPRLILANYGSTINGLISSVNQFLSVITFLDLGVGAVVQSSLYKPLARRDNEQISLVLSSAKRYFRKISYVLICYVVLLVTFYPLLVRQDLNFLSTAFLILAMSISSFSQYYFGIVNELLLNADQKSYVQLTSEIVVVIMNLLVSVLLIQMGASIQFVKLISGIVFLIRPIYLTYYVNKHYNVSFDMEINNEPIKQKWNGMAQHIAYTVQNSTDIVLLTIFSTLDEISIYSIYNIAVNGIRMIIISLTNGLKSFFGNLIAENETKLLSSYFSQIELLVHNLVVYLFGLTGVLINSFVLIYTSGVNDIDYNRPVFAILLVLSQAMYCLRTPYQSLVLSAGHFKETQMSSIIEVLINIILSLVLVFRYGLVGVAFGTLCSMSYRTFYLVSYLSKNILKKSVSSFIKLFMMDILVLSVMFIIGFYLNTNPNNLMEWIINALLFATLFLGIVLLFNFIFYRTYIIGIIKGILKRK